MNISLNESLESYIKEKVSTGGYNNTSEVVREALRLLKEQDQKKQALLNTLQKGFDNIESGHISTKTPNKIFDEVLSKRGNTKKNIG